MERLITLEELGERLSMSRSSLFRLKREGLPSIRISHKVVRYDMNDVIQWLKDRNENQKKAQ